MNRFQHARWATLALSLTLALSGASCKSLKDHLKKYAPDIRLVDAKVSAINLEGADVDFKYEMRNKVSVSLTFSRLAYKLLIDGNRLLEANNKKDIKLESKATTHFTITHRVVFSEFAQSLIDLYKKDQVLVRVEGVAGVRVPSPINDTVEVPIEAEKVITIPKLPDVKFGTFAYKSASLNPFKPRAKFELKFKVRNPNKFNIDIATINYGFVAASEQIIDGDTGKVSLPAGQEREVAVPVNLKGKKIINLVPKLRDLKSTSFKLSGEIQLKVASQTLKLPYSVP